MILIQDALIWIAMYGWHSKALASAPAVGHQCSRRVDTLSHGLVCIRRSLHSAVITTSNKSVNEFQYSVWECSYCISVLHRQAYTRCTCHVHLFFWNSWFSSLNYYSYGQFDMLSQPVWPNVAMMNKKIASYNPTLPYAIQVMYSTVLYSFRDLNLKPVSG